MSRLVPFPVFARHCFAALQIFEDPARFVNDVLQGEAKILVSSGQPVLQLDVVASVEPLVALCDDEKCVLWVALVEDVGQENILAVMMLDLWWLEGDLL